MPSAEPTQPPRQASPATPPKEGNWLVQNPHDHPVKRSLTPLHRRGISWYRIHTTTPSGCACHPSEGGELAGAEPTRPPRQASLATPPKEGNGLALCLYRHEATTPSSFACHPSAGGELAGTEPTQLPRQAELDTPPQEGNCLPPQEENDPSLPFS